MNLQLDGENPICTLLGQLLASFFHGKKATVYIRSEHV